MTATTARATMPSTEGANLQRTVDALIAFHIFGKPVVRKSVILGRLPNGEWGALPEPQVAFDQVLPDGTATRIPHYSTNMTEAWKVVQKVAENDVAGTHDAIMAGVFRDAVRERWSQGHTALTLCLAVLRIYEIPVP